MEQQRQPGTIKNQADKLIMARYLHKLQQGTLFFIILLSAFSPSPKNTNLQHCGIASTLEEMQNIIRGFASTLKEIQNIFQGIQSFIDNIASFTSILGFSTIILFIFVILLSAGLTTLGLEKGKTSFLAALIIADILWILWKESFNPESRIYLTGIMKSNAFLLTPLFIVSFIKWLSPRFFTKAKKAIVSIFKRKGSGFKKNQLLQAYDRYSALNSETERAIIQDIADAGKNEKVMLSNDTVKNLKELEKIITGILKRSE
jgi:hypothetical protein